MRAAFLPHVQPTLASGIGFTPDTAWLGRSPVRLILRPDSGPTRAGRPMTAPRSFRPDQARRSAKHRRGRSLRRLDGGSRGSGACLGLSLDRRAGRTPGAAGVGARGRRSGGGKVAGDGRGAGGRGRGAGGRGRGAGGRGRPGKLGELRRIWAGPARVPGTSLWGGRTLRRGRSGAPSPGGRARPNAGWLCDHPRAVFDVRASRLAARLQSSFERRCCAFGPTVPPPCVRSSWS
jgi:hypothetical protein